MNSSAGEEIQSPAEVPETNEVTVTTVITTSTTNTQSVASAGTFIPLLTNYVPLQTFPGYRYQSSGYQQSVANYQECPINFNRPHYTAPPTKEQEIYHMYCMNDHANHVARRAYEKGWISKARVKKIFHRGLEESFEGYREGYLPPLYLNNMINYGKFYKYLSRC